MSEVSKAHTPFFGAPKRQKGVETSTEGGTELDHVAVHG